MNQLMTANDCNPNLNNEEKKGEQNPYFHYKHEQKDGFLISVEDLQIDNVLIRSKS